jgi:hypothetical protein
MLIDTKSLLAKLMATENIIVEQRKVPTAMFNVKDRILTVPIFSNEITNEQYDLFIGHEVGHALWTPIEGMVLGIKEKINTGVLNVVEDSRIERKIKNKYPGLRNSFIRAYSQLYKDNFFGTGGADVNTFNFIDRVNLFCKIGVSIGIKFNDQERELLKEVESTETYNDVIEVSKRIVEFMKQQKKEKEEQREKEKEEENQQEDEFGSFDSDFDGDQEFEEKEDSDKEENPKSESGVESDEEPDEEESEEESDDSEETSDELEQGQESQQDSMEDSDEEVRAHTDEAASENQQKYNAENAKEYKYVNIPEVKTKDVIFGYKEMYSEYRKLEKAHPHYYSVDHQLFQKIRKETNKVVSYLAKEFELRKNADQLKRASVAKTGELNMSKIFSYQFSEDIFKKVTVVPGGKSHGLVMFIDWSGSMIDHIHNTVKQLISLVMFCKKVNIPYEVYAFADSSSFHQYSSEAKLGTLRIDQFSLLNLLSSKMSAAEFNYAAAALITISFSPGKAPGFMRLSGTPLNEAVISALHIVPEFQKQNKLQMVNTVFLTDGDGQTMNQMWDRDLEGNLMIKSVSGRHTPSTLVIRDPVTFQQQKVDDIYNCKQMTSALVQLLKHRTGSNVLGFYIISGRMFNRSIHGFFPDFGNDLDAIKAKFRKEKSVVLTNAGFDEYYILRSEGLDTEDDVELQVKENSSTRTLVTAFSKYTGGRVANRMILNRFIGLIT